MKKREKRLLILRYFMIAGIGIVIAIPFYVCAPWARSNR